MTFISRLRYVVYEFRFTCVIMAACFAAKWTKCCVMFNKGRKPQTAHLNLFIIYLDIMKNNGIIKKKKHMKNSTNKCMTDKNNAS